MSCARLSPPSSASQHCCSSAISHPTSSVATWRSSTAGLAGDFLDVKLLAGGDLTLVRMPFDLVDLVREQTELFFLQPASHRLSLDVPGDPLVVDGDRDRLSQVVGNLLSNAIKYSPEDGEVRVSVRFEGSDAVVAVSDDGIG